MTTTHTTFKKTQHDAPLRIKVEVRCHHRDGPTACAAAASTLLPFQRTPPRPHPAPFPRRAEPPAQQNVGRDAIPRPHHARPRPGLGRGAAHDARAVRGGIDDGCGGAVAADGLAKEQQGQGAAGQHQGGLQRAGEADAAAAAAAAGVVAVAVVVLREEEGAAELEQAVEEGRGPTAQAQAAGAASRVAAPILGPRRRPLPSLSMPAALAAPAAAACHALGRPSCCCC